MHDRRSSLERVAAPVEELGCHLPRRQGRGIDHLHGPAVLVTPIDPAFPAHLLPAIGLQHMGHMTWVLRVSAHPAGEREMRVKKRGIIAASLQPCRLSFRIEIEQAHGNAVKPVCRRRSQHFARRDRVPGEQQVPIVGLELERALHGRLGSLLAPSECWRGRDIDQIVQLDAFD